MDVKDYRELSLSFIQEQNNSSDIQNVPANAGGDVDFLGLGSMNLFVKSISNKDSLSRCSLVIGQENSQF